ncbi:ATP-dependent DNA helicase Q-like SIM [Dendronephthya gigantea]|uniref:ATP-dependent DNA helicase Q-like SIM n=1 Tax=Dendronephthya gigantea TaxID=151771 RepID=UPI00106B1C08|nr:ATP-dependent DNA helicase Q-like SIM [Dendronephthya gigantea]
MGARSDGDVESSRWNRVVQKVLDVFKIPSLYEEQSEALRQFFSKRDVFVSLPTCYGKSLIYQAVPFMADVIYRRSSGSSIIVVISPLKALMDDQVRYLQKLGVTAVCVTDEHDDKLVGEIINGHYTHIYGSPECLLTSTWRGILSSRHIKSSLVCVAVDEAHCISQWGTPGAKKGELPFRKWYGNLGELRSLVPDEVNMIVATASATKETKAVIYESLQLTKNTAVVSKSPDRSNFDVIENVRIMGTSAARTIIYCQMRKQSAVLYRVFETSLGHKFYMGGVPNCKACLVEMYHAGTPKAVKRYISKSMSENEGCIRVLISTVAFGMGVDCKQVNRIIHFGPSKNIECYVQESGHAGRYGSPSECILLYNGLLSSHSSRDIKEILYDETGCRRESLSKPFGFVPITVNNRHTCCDSCAKKCNCGEAQCLPGSGLTILSTTNEESKQTRPVSVQQRKELKEKLIAFKKDLSKESSEQMHNTVTLPTVLLEFGTLQILSILRHCYKIFFVSDVIQYGEVWREQHACRILSLINDVFGDITNISVLDNDDESEIIADMDW